MNIQNSAAQSICIVVPALILSAFLAHHVVAREINPEEADHVVGRMLLVTTGFLVISTLLVCLISAIVQRLWIPFVQIACGLLLVSTGAWMTWTRRRQVKSEKVILSLGRVENAMVRLPGYIFSLGFGMVLIMTIAEDDFALRTIGLLAFLGGAGFYWSLVGFGAVYFTENGIFRNQTGVTPWQEINAYTWEGNLNTTLVLHGKKIRRLWFRLRIKQLEPVNTFFHQLQIPDLQATGNKT